MKIDSLTAREKVLLAQELWDSVASDEQSLSLSSDQVEVLKERLQNFEDDSELGSSWDSTKSRILNI